MNFIRSLITCTFLLTYAAYSADTFDFPPFIEVPCYKSQTDRDPKNQPLSIVAVPFWPELTLNLLQELIRDQKGPGYLWFGTKKTGDMGQGAESPVGDAIGDFHALELFMENIYFVLSGEMLPNAASPKISSTKKQ
jgi:hypothetical protein